MNNQPNPKGGLKDQTEFFRLKLLVEKDLRKNEIILGNRRNWHV